MELLKGRFVRSLSGRDKEGIFVVVGVTDEGYLLLADGKTRKLETPKRKKRKHAELLPEEQFGRVGPEGMLTNRLLKKATTQARALFDVRKE